MIDVIQCKVQLVAESVKQYESVNCTNSFNTARIFQTLMNGLPHEEVHILFVDAKKQLRGSYMASRGGQYSASLGVGDIYRSVIAAGVGAFIIGHNHPSGDCTPSKEDIELTKGIVKCGNILNVYCLDHIVVSGKSFKSIREINPSIWN